MGWCIALSRWLILSRQFNVSSSHWFLQLCQNGTGYAWSKVSKCCFMRNARLPKKHQVKLPNTKLNINFHSCTKHSSLPCFLLTFSGDLLLLFTDGLTDNLHWHEAHQWICKDSTRGILLGVCCLFAGAAQSGWGGWRPREKTARPSVWRWWRGLVLKWHVFL